MSCEQGWVDEVGNGGGVVDGNFVATVAIDVELAVKAADVINKVAIFGTACFQIIKVGGVHDDFVGYIKAEHGDRPIGGEDNIGSMGIADDVGFGGGGDVAARRDQVAVRIESRRHGQGGAGQGIGELVRGVEAPLPVISYT